MADRTVQRIIGKGYKTMLFETKERDYFNDVKTIMRQYKVDFATACEFLRLIETTKLTEEVTKQTELLNAMASYIRYM